MFKAQSLDELCVFPGGYGWQNIPADILGVALKKRNVRRLETGKCSNFLNGVKSRNKKETTKQVTKWR